jgi:uncharacterized protein (TIGR03435 family)
MRFLLAGCVVSCALAQTAIEVSSVRTRTAYPPGGGSLTVSGPRLTIVGFQLRAVLWYAYRIRDFQLENSRALDSTIYDIAVTATDGRPRTRDDARELAQAVLADRFHLKVHWQQRDLPIYALLVDKRAPNFEKTSPDAAPGIRFEVDGPNTRTIFQKVTMSDFAERVRANAGLDRPVFDRTGLTGTYKLVLTYTAESRRHGDPEEVDIFTAVRRLGLRLERQTALVEMLVIDHIERPSEN